MAFKASAPIVLLSVYLLFFTFVTSQTPPPPPPSPPPPPPPPPPSPPPPPPPPRPPPPPSTCNLQNLTSCAMPILPDAATNCCNALLGNSNQAAVCLCKFFRTFHSPIGQYTTAVVTTVIVDVCGRSLPTGFSCASS
ncbi:hypothetical protein V6N13_017472 [Hibiscus sabdariffa]|uniref:Hydrophobic seed protein domain-containing protein n=2 Tax=Hibiscus sabdariffa TaxID=183260 RepID=A0ABR1ZUD2_9ROSI